MSVPTLVNRNGAVRTIEVEMTPDEQLLFELSAGAIENSLASLGL
jgi:malate/lactate dehydrogenase